MSVLRFLVSSVLVAKFQPLAGIVALVLLTGLVCGRAEAAENAMKLEETSAPQLLASFIEDEKRPSRRPSRTGKPEASRSSWAFYIDNDLFALSTRDRDYTGGLSFTLSGAIAERHLFSLGGALNRINQAFAISPTSGEVLHSFEVGVNAFTPSETDVSAAQHDDRPYASLVYMANSRQYLDHRRRSSVVTTLTLGALGLNIGGAIQNGIHSLVGSDEAQGWDNQISDGGELTFRYSIAHQKTAWLRYNGDMQNIEIKTAVRGSVGYLTGATVGVSGRWGRIVSPWWSFNPQLSDYAEKSAPSFAASNTLRHRNEFYLWVGANLHLRAYNALLQGQFRDSAVSYSSDQLEHLLLESWIGITKTFSNGYRVSYLIRNQTSELKVGNGDRAITWGGLIVGKAF